MAIASFSPGTGACALASAMQLWLLSLKHLSTAKDAYGKPLFQSKRQGVTFPLADALGWILSAHQLILDVLELARKAPENPNLKADAPALVQFYQDLCHVQVARAAGEVGRICAELSFGYNAHPRWNSAMGCFQAENIDAIEALVPGISLGARAKGDCIESDGSHGIKAGPCVDLQGMDEFLRLRNRLDGCLTGSRLAKDRAAEAITQVMIPAALDYPA
jgi:hypothetical protein